MRNSNIANHRFLENYKNEPRLQWLAQIARMCFLIMHRCVMDMQKHHNHYLLNLHTPLPPLKKDGSSKICWKSHFSKSTFLLILRVVRAVNGSKMEVENSSTFWFHSLACSLDFLSIVFVVEHWEFKKKMDHRKYAQNLIFQSRLSCWFWEFMELLMALQWNLRSPLSFFRIV